MWPNNLKQVKQARNVGFKATFPALVTREITQGISLCKFTVLLFLLVYE